MINQKKHGLASAIIVIPLLGGYRKDTEIEYKWHEKAGDSNGRFFL